MRKRQTIASLTRSDQVFFQDFYEANKNLLYYLARKYTVSPVEAEDLVQDSVVRLISNVSTLRKLSKNKSAKYVALTVRSAFIDHEKVRKREKLLLVEQTELENMAPAQPITDPEEILLPNMMVAKLKNEIPVRDWFVIEAKYILELSDQEIGSLIGVSSGSVRMILHRAKQKAKAVLDDR